MNISVTTSWALPKQRMQIIEKASLSKVGHIEQKILDAASFPQCVGDFKVELTKPPNKFKATFNAGSEVISKECENLAKIYEWLLSLVHAYKRGDLHKGLRNIQRSAQQEVAMDKAVNALAAKGSDLTTSVQAMQPDASPANGNSERAVEDVTNDILEVTKTSTAELRKSTICVHKGSYNTFMKLCSASQELVGVLLGKKAWNSQIHVVQIVISTGSLEALLAEGRVKSGARGNGLEFCGAIVKGQEKVWIEKCHHFLRQFGNCSHPLLICADFSDQITGVAVCWELDNTSDVDVEIGTAEPVSLSWTTNPHDSQRRLRYNICWLADLNVSHVENATRKICEAVVDHVTRESILKATPKSPCPESLFRLVPVPADGLCGWHSLLAAFNIKKYQAVPRKASAYATNHTMQEQEVLAAKHFHQKTCDDALKNLDDKFQASILRVKDNAAFDPSDLEWISEAIGTSVLPSHSGRSAELLLLMGNVDRATSNDDETLQRSAFNRCPVFQPKAWKEMTQQMTSQTPKRKRVIHNEDKDPTHLKWGGVTKLAAEKILSGVNVSGDQCGITPATTSSLEADHRSQAQAIATMFKLQPAATGQCPEGPAAAASNREQQEAEQQPLQESKSPATEDDGHQPPASETVTQTAADTSHLEHPPPQANTTTSSPAATHPHAVASHVENNTAKPLPSATHSEALTRQEQQQEAEQQPLQESKSSATEDDGHQPSASATVTQPAADTSHLEHPPNQPQANTVTSSPAATLPHAVASHAENNTTKPLSSATHSEAPTRQEQQQEAEHQPLQESKSSATEDDGHQPSASATVTQPAADTSHLEHPPPQANTTTSSPAATHPHAVASHVENNTAKPLPSATHSEALTRQEQQQEAEQQPLQESKSSATEDDGHQPPASETVTQPAADTSHLEHPPNQPQANTATSSPAATHPHAVASHVENNTAKPLPSATHSEALTRQEQQQEAEQQPLQESKSSATEDDGHQPPASATVTQPAADTSHLEHPPPQANTAIAPPAATSHVEQQEANQQTSTLRATEDAIRQEVTQQLMQSLLQNLGSNDQLRLLLQQSLGASTDPSTLTQQLSNSMGRAAPPQLEEQMQVKKEPHTSKQAKLPQLGKNKVIDLDTPPQVRPLRSVKQEPQAQAEQPIADENAVHPKPPNMVSTPKRKLGCMLKERAALSVRKELQKKQPTWSKRGISPKLHRSDLALPSKIIGDLALEQKRKMIKREQPEPTTNQHDQEEVACLMMRQHQFDSLRRTGIYLQTYNIVAKKLPMEFNIILSLQDGGKSVCVATCDLVN
eukprot:Skav208282  [mRNA]  locus=scaffold1802:270691:275564:+ [translate_table: standard]